MSTVKISPYIRAPLTTNQIARNGLYPDATVQQHFIEETNRLLAHRTKCVAAFATPLWDGSATVIPDPDNTASTRARWRFMFHSSSHVRYLRVLFDIAQFPPTFSGLTPPTDPYGKLEVKNGAGTVVAVAEFHYGKGDAASSTSLVSPADIGTALVYAADPSASTAIGTPVVLTPNTDYYCTVTDEGGARIASVAVFEESLDTTIANGFIDPEPAAQSPILNSHRSEVVQALRTAWKRNAAGLWTWASNTDATAPTNATSTQKNLIDGSLSNASGRPVARLDLRNRKRVSSTTVPCKLFVFAKHSTGSSGIVSLRDDATGTILASVTSFGTTAEWKSATVDLPNTEADYALYHANNGSGTITTYAATLIQYEE